VDPYGSRLAPTKVRLYIAPSVPPRDRHRVGQESRNSGSGDEVSALPAWAFLRSHDEPSATLVSGAFFPNGFRLQFFTTSPSGPWSSPPRRPLQIFLRLLSPCVRYILQENVPSCAEVRAPPVRNVPIFRGITTGELSDTGYTPPVPLAWPVPSPGNPRSQSPLTSALTRELVIIPFLEKIFLTNS